MNGIPNCNILQFFGNAINQVCSWSSGKHKGKKANKEPGDSSDADSQARVAAIIQFILYNQSSEIENE